MEDEIEKAGKAIDSPEAEKRIEIAGKGVDELADEMEDETEKEGKSLTINKEFYCDKNHH